MAITGRRPTLTDCGCEATVYADGSGIELHYCPMHQAAPQLLEALKVLREHCDYADLRQLADAAIAAAGG
jgi:hypothetical protein